jgi:translation initiation factor IF-3
MSSNNNSGGRPPSSGNRPPYRPPMNRPAGPRPAISATARSRNPELPKKSADEPRINREITLERIRLIGADGEMVGIVSIRDGLRAAEEAGLDLVEISPNAEPPVCKVLDYGKYKYQQQKKAQEAKKKQKVIEIKEIKLRPGIDKHDLEIKMRHVHEFLKEGDKVKFTLRFRGREMAHQELGMKVLIKVKEQLADLVRVEQEPRSEGRQMVMVVAPK